MSALARTTTTALMRARMAEVPHIELDMATRDEADSTRGRANALRLAISGQLGADGLADPALGRALELCLECKACKTECPTGVDMARMKIEVLHQQVQLSAACSQLLLL